DAPFLLIFLHSSTSHLPPPPFSPLFPYTTLFRSFLAAARTIVGPPISICSIACGAAAPDATVSTNGYRLATTRSNGAISCSASRSEEHTSELQSRFDLVCRLLLEKKKKNTKPRNS